MGMGHMVDGGVDSILDDWNHPHDHSVKRRSAVTCPLCDGRGLYPFVEPSNPKPDSAITFADLWFAVCLCDAGQTYRLDMNCGRQVAPLWRVWCAIHQVDPNRVFLLEDVFTAEQIAAAGYVASRQKPSREAALLAAGRSKR